MSDETGTILFVNQQVEITFGFTAEELVGHRIEEFVPKDRRAAHHERWKRFWAKPESRAMTANGELFARKDGSEAPVEVGLTLIERD
ncbi:MAG TPA: PAS domain S-box protein, partial [Vicinamibacterales bacterium]